MVAFMRHLYGRVPRLVVLPLLFAGTLCASGCSKGAVTCQDYNAMSGSDRTSAASDLLKQHGESDTTLSEITVRGSVAAYCFLHSGDSPIDGIYK